MTPEREEACGFAISAVKSNRKGHRERKEEPKQPFPFETLAHQPQVKHLASMSSGATFRFQGEKQSISAADSLHRMRKPFAKSGTTIGIAASAITPSCSCDSTISTQPGQTSLRRFGRRMAIFELWLLSENSGAGVARRLLVPLSDLISPERIRIGNLELWIRAFWRRCGVGWPKPRIPPITVSSSFPSNCHKSFRFLRAELAKRIDRFFALATRIVLFSALSKPLIRS